MLQPDGSIPPNRVLRPSASDPTKLFDGATKSVVCATKVGATHKLESEPRHTLLRRRRKGLQRHLDRTPEVDSVKLWHHAQGIVDGDFNAVMPKLRYIRDTARVKHFEVAAPAGDERLGGDVLCLGVTIQTKKHDVRGWLKPLWVGIITDAKQNRTLNQARRRGLTAGIARRQHCYRAKKKRAPKRHGAASTPAELIHLITPAKYG